MRTFGKVRNPAFTLIELLAVIAILAILAGIVMGGINAVRHRTAATRTRAELAVLATALEGYQRHYGDYPQLGEFEHASLASAPGPAPGIRTVEARLFNCLTGVFGPGAFGPDDRLAGPNFLEGSRFLHVSGTSRNGLLGSSFLVPLSDGTRPPYRTEQDVCLVDAFGRCYVYYYKNRQSPTAWQAPGYLLYSVGRDGAHAAPGPSGVFTSAEQFAPSNADNIYANR